MTRLAKISSIKNSQFVLLMITENGATSADYKKLIKVVKCYAFNITANSFRKMKNGVAAMKSW